MGEPGGSTRMNISVPADLKRQMDAADAGVNWSAVAAAAFRTELLRLQAASKSTKMQDVITRLKAEVELESKEAFTEGYAKGQQWAKTEAKPRQFKRLHKAVDSMGWDYREYVTAERFRSHRRPTDHVAADISGADIDSVDYADADAFWDRVLGQGGAGLILDEDFACGFVEAVMDIWQAVANEL